MDSGIGTTLRETRSRRKVSLDEVEAATKIRARYLQALENEDWDVLPGGAYTRGFIRTYASYLGLDGDRLAEEYRRSSGPSPGERAPRVEPAATPGGGRRPGRARTRALAVALLAALIGAAIAIGVVAGGDETKAPKPTGTRKKEEGGAQPAGTTAAPRTASGVSVQLAARAEVWVCLVDARGSQLIDGQILEAGAEEGPFRSSSFTVSFGNGEVSLRVDGSEAEVPATSSPIGYRIGADGALSQLDEAERPTCA
jgi:transcriptional regulator with XRE-family HTH domain